MSKYSSDAWHIVVRIYIYSLGYVEGLLLSEFLCFTLQSNEVRNKIVLEVFLYK